MNIIEWEPFNCGECYLEFYNLNGEPFSGEQDEFETEHICLFGLKNKTTGMVILINHYGDIAAKTPNKSGIS